MNGTDGNSPARPDLIGAELPLSALALLVVALAAAWVGAHRLAIRRRAAPLPVHGAWFLLRAGVGAATLWSAIQLLGRFLVLGSPWSIWANAIVGAVALETVFSLYRWEADSVSRRRGRTLLVLRSSAVALVLLVLLEPILARLMERRLEREVVVLVDESESMRLVDSEWTAGDRLRLGRMAGVASALDQPRISGHVAALGDAARSLANAAGTLEPRDPDEPVGAAAAEGVRASLEAAVVRIRSASEGLGEARDDLSSEMSGVASEAMRLLDERMVPQLERFAAGTLTDARSGEIRDALRAAAADLDAVGNRLTDASDAFDESWLASLPASDRARIDEIAGQSRIELVDRLLHGESPANEAAGVVGAGEGDPAETSVREPSASGTNQGGLLSHLRDRYGVRVVRFAREARETVGPTDDAGLQATPPREVSTGTEPVDDDGAKADSDADAPVVDDTLRTTDIARAMEAAAEEIAPETLAGIVLLSDGRHNAPSPIEDISRRLSVLGAPVGAVAIGAERGAPDAAVLALDAPESIYLEDRVPVRADLKFEGLPGRSARVVLLRDGEVIDEEEVEVPTDQFRTQVRFRHVPESKGVFSYSVRIDPVEGERSSRNNEWSFDVAVTDDRRNVLLVDAYPRWEFRYLRNLFYARDKSVHLQYVLLNPEPIAGMPPRAPVAASASRPFGEAEATTLPASEEEWRKFDAIILGDVPPATFDAETWGIIDRCVRDRGALLVLVAGPRHLPHAFDDPTFRSLAPVDYAFDPNQLRFVSPEPSYRLTLTAEGRASEVMRQAPSGLVNAAIWNGLPELHWRHPVLGTREGAEVLAYAVPLDDAGNPADRAAIGARSLLEQRQDERARPLIVTQRFALGSVAMLLFDRTWRFRFGVGDTYHHRLWGQLLRWGTGENLRAGTEFVRLGTDRLEYLPGESVRIVARLTGRDHRPVVDDQAHAAIHRDGTRIMRVPLRYRESSNGIHEAEVRGLDIPGVYRVVLESEKADSLLAEDGSGPLEVEVTVGPERNPVELAELAVDRDTLRTIAGLSGGKVVAPDEAGDLVALFGEPARIVEETVETSLWDKWPVLVLFLGLISAEWIVRRQGGLV